VGNDAHPSLARRDTVLMVPDQEPWSSQFSAVGAFIRRQRTLHNLSIRELADLASVSNAYLSQIERGLHEPSVRVLTSVAKALNVSAETLLAQAGLLEERFNPGAAEPGRGSREATEAAIRADARLSTAQKEALLGVYRSYLAEGAPVSGAATAVPGSSKPGRPAAATRATPLAAERSRRPVKRPPAAET
jgi:transcriptional regulator with XRE-family HTH domain